MRCDFCHGRLSEGERIYAYQTPSTGTLEEAEKGEAFWCEDPKWAACQSCHETIQAVESGEILGEAGVVALVRKSLANQNFIVIGPPIPGMEEGQIEFVAGVINAFFANRAPGFVEETA